MRTEEIIHFAKVCYSIKTKDETKMAMVESLDSRAGSIKLKVCPKGFC